jgi:hypothetical protein
MEGLLGITVEILVGWTADTENLDRVLCNKSV